VQPLGGRTLSGKEGMDVRLVAKRESVELGMGLTQSLTSGVWVGKAVRAGLGGAGRRLGE
jgi:hypothetical protein